MRLIERRLAKIVTRSDHSLCKASPSRNVTGGCSNSSCIIIRVNKLTFPVIAFLISAWPFSALACTSGRLWSMSSTDTPARYQHGQQIEMLENLDRDIEKRIARSGASNHASPNLELRTESLTVGEEVQHGARLVLARMSRSSSSDHVLKHECRVVYLQIPSSEGNEWLSLGREARYG